MAGGTVLVLLALFSLPTLIILIPGMLPTGVAKLCDRTEQHSATFCVGGLNICGVFPYLMKLWTDNHSIDAATAAITDIFTMLVIYAAAGFGWLMYSVVPPVVSAVLNVLAERRVSVLKTTQVAIVKEWGPEVALMTEPGGQPPLPPNA